MRLSCCLQKQVNSASGNNLEILACYYAEYGDGKSARSEDDFKPQESVPGGVKIYVDVLLCVLNVLPHRLQHVVGAVDLHEVGLQQILDSFLRL